MKTDLVKQLRHQNELPSRLKEMEDGLIAVKLMVAEAADEIERLRKELKSKKNEIESLKHKIRFNYGNP